MRRRRRVVDVMTRDLIGVHPSTPFQQIAWLLAGKRIGAVPVLDPAGRPLGLVSESDLIRKEQLQALRPGRISLRLRCPRARAAPRTAEQLMSRPAVTVGHAARLPAAAQLMATWRIARLIVVDLEGIAIGIVTRSDLLRD